jgi:hypothetical protein
MKTGNFIPIDAQFLKAPKGFQAAGPPVERRFFEARYLASVQAHAKPFRCVAPGMLLTGEARCQVFSGSVPTGVLIPPYTLTDLAPRWIASGVAWSDGLLKLNGHALSGDPTALKDGSQIGIMGWNLAQAQLALEASWAALRWALKLGEFTAEEFAVFATAPRNACLTFLREAAHYFVEQQLDLVHPRARLEIYKKAAAVLPGFSKADAACSEARALFDEALLAAVTAASGAELLALVTALTEGGASEAG